MIMITIITISRKAIIITITTINRCGTAAPGRPGPPASTRHNTIHNTTTKNDTNNGYYTIYIYIYIYICYIHVYQADVAMLRRMLSDAGEYQLLAQLLRDNGPQRHINGVVSKKEKYDNFGFGGIQRPF